MAPRTAGTGTRTGRINGSQRAMGEEQPQWKLRGRAAGLPLLAEPPTEPPTEPLTEPPLTEPPTEPPTGPLTEPPPTGPPTEPLGALLLRRLREHRNPKLQIDAESGRAESAQQVLSRSISVAMELRGRGLGPGDVVALALDNCLEALPLLLGCLYVGAIFAPLNPAFDAEDLRRLLALLKPRLLLYAPRAAAALRLALPPGLPAVQLRPDSADWAAFVRPRGAAAEADFRADGSAGPETTIAVLCSSGTTGPPKGVQICQRALHLFLELMDAERPRYGDSRDVDALVSAVFWVSGVGRSLLAARCGSSLLVLRDCGAGALLAAVQRYRVSSLYLAPDRAVAVAKHPRLHERSCDLSSVLSLTSGGAALSQPVRRQLEQRLNRPLVLVYGMTEALAVVTPGPLHACKPATVGTVAPHCTLKVVDLETGRTVGPHTQGELYVKGPSVFTGYYNNPAATAAAFDSNGWLRTGDIVSFDEDGYFYVHDRCKELIKRKGLHIYPAEIEGVLVAHEGVLDAAVAGVHDDEDDEHAVGLVVRRPGTEVTAEELHELVKSNLPEYKWLHGGIYFVEEIPRTGSGKVMRRNIRQLASRLTGK